ncbi:MAG: MraZ protein [Paracoccaceae bacterium]
MVTGNQKATRPMGQRFTSNSVHKVDSKGRVSVPAGFRRVLEQASEPGVVLISDFRGRGHIEGYTQDEMAIIYADIEAMDRYSEEREDLEMEITSQTVHLPLDENGRILLTKAVLAENGITDTAVFLGMGTHFQIWSPKRLEEMKEARRERRTGAAFAKLPGTPRTEGAA